MEAKKKLVSLIDDLKEYVNLKIQLLKLTVAEKAAHAMASLIATIVLILLAFVVLLFGSLAVAFLLGECLNSYAAGFGIVAGFYLLIALIILLTKKKIIEKPLMDKFISLLLKKHSEDEHEG